MHVGAPRAVRAGSGVLPDLPQGEDAGTLLSWKRRLTRDDETLHHHIGVSCFAERAVVSRRSVVKIDPDLPFRHAALFGCAVLTGVGAVVNTAQVKAGSSVAVTCSEDTPVRLS